MATKAKPKKHHIAVYGGKRVVIDYVADPKREFSVAAMRVHDNLGAGEIGHVITPAGKRYEISRASRKAKLVK